MRTSASLLLLLALSLAACGSGRVYVYPAPPPPAWDPPPGADGPTTFSATTTPPPPPEPAPRFDVDALFSTVVTVHSLKGNMGGQCLGAMVAPRIAVTAAHCVPRGAAQVTVAPASDAKAKRIAVESHWFDPARKIDGKLVDEDTADVAVLELTAPVKLPVYARYARNPVRSEVAAVGMRNSPNAIDAMGFRLSPHPTQHLYYRSVGFGAPGDSGAPVFAMVGGETLLVGVLAGGSPGREVFARVDVFSDILDRVTGSRVEQPGATVLASRPTNKPPPPKPPKKP